MTPIKAILVLGVMIMVEDMAGGIELKATCPNERDAEWLAGSLAQYHHVPVIGMRDANHSMQVMVAN